MPLPRALGRDQLRQPGLLGQRHHRYQARTRQGEPNEHHPQEQLGIAGGVGLLIPALAGLASLGLAALLTGAVITDQFVLEQSPWLPLAFLVVAAVIARARWSRTEAVVGTLLRR